jgi:flagella basal body P-ring formation protein FlgA
LNFRLSEALKPQGEVMSSDIKRLVILLAGWVFGMSFSLANTATMNQDLIEQAVTAQLNKELSILASQRHWQQYQAQFTLWVPSSVKHLPLCHSDLVIEGRNHQTIPVGNLKRMVRCDDGSHDWRLNVTVKSVLSLPVVVAQSTLNRDEEISAKELKLETRTLSRATDFLTSVADAAGQRPTRRIRSGQVLDGALLIAPPLVQKGNEVIIIASKDGFNASTKGIALERGSRGDQIEVQNLRSKKVIRAVVSGLNQVHTQF